MTTLATTSGGMPFRIGGKLALLSGAAVTPPAPMPDPAAALPTTGLVAAWDASSLSTLGIAAWNSFGGSIPDLSGAGRNASTTANAKPRQAGLMGGLYAAGNTGNYSVMHPVINDYAVNASNIPVGTGQLLTVFLVWSRPLQRQPNQGARSTLPVSLLDINGTTVISMTAAGNGADVLTLFPNGAPVTGGTLQLRHTRSLRVVFSGATVDVWLDAVKVISGATNQITLGATASLSFLNASQCIFHEAAAWNVALPAGDHTTLTSHATRWPLGARRAANGVVIGQSNMDLITTGVIWPQLNTLVAYWTGCIASNLLWGGNISGGQTTFSGQGLYSLFDTSSGAGNVANWPLSANGNAYMTAIDSMTADDRANLRYVFWYWSESDSSTLTYADKATYTAMMKRFIAFVRARASLTAAQLPVMVINALPFTTDVGCQTHREVMADLVADATQNVRFMMAQTDDALSQGDSWNATTGAESGPGNSAHREPADAATFLRRAAPPIARAVVAANAAAGTPDVITAIDASVPVTSGPKITAAHYEGTTYAATGTILVTVAHDGGSDLLVPLRAALGVGWRLMDGISASVAGTPGAPGTFIKATACVRVSATQLRITLASLPTYAAKAQLYYVYGSGFTPEYWAEISRGNAVTDNFAATTLTAGWNIGQDQGASAQPNNPLQATTYGIALT